MTKLRKDGQPDRRVGNKFYQMRERHGRKKKFETPEAMEQAILDYFEWNEANPFTDYELVKHQGNAKNVEVQKRRPLSIRGLCISLGMSHEAWIQYCQRKDFVEVTSRARETIERDQIEGAMAEIYNANIVARLNGLSDKHEVTAPIVVLNDDDRSV
jgi:hypothetical protein